MRATRTAFAFLAVTAFAIAAEEKSAPPAEKAAPKSGDSIDAAKRQFDAVKAARGTPTANAAELPSLATPEATFGSLGSTNPSLRNEAAAAAAKKKSANWLVDAMNDKTKKSTNANDRDRDKEKLSDELDLAAGALPGAEEKRDAERDREKTAAAKRTEPNVNPLDRYMASWVTPQDLALLRPVMIAENNKGLGDSLDISGSSLATGTAGNSAANAFGLIAPPGSASPASTAPRENPFLQSLGPLPQSITALPAPPAANAPASASTPPSVAAPPEPPGTPKSPTPSFVKPRDDEKYYKQMKRF